MEVTLKVDITIPDPSKALSGGAILIRAGTRITPIRASYVPKGSMIFPFHSHLYGAEKLEQEYFIFYMRGMFIAVKKDECDIPRSIGWRANI